VPTRKNRRTEILATAARLFAASGFNGVSIDDLGAEIGISGPAIYRYFPGKEAILGEMLVGISRRLLDGAMERVASEQTPHSALLALIDFHTEFALADRDLIAVQYRDLGSVTERERRVVRELQSAYTNTWVEVLQKVYPELTRERATSGVHAVFGLLNSTPYSARGGDPAAGKQLRAMASAALASAGEMSKVMTEDEPSHREG
jgi:AcrR family transcriptional regulator